MLIFRCKNCNAEMSVSRIGDLKCPYCGSHKFFSDKELSEYKEFRMRMLEYLSASANEESSSVNLERLWNNAETAEFLDSEKNPICIQYIYKSVNHGITMYAAIRNVIFIYPKDKRNYADMAIKAFSKVTFPQADMKGLGRCFPVFAGKYELEDESIMLVYSKDENMYPVGMFGALPAKHVEWIISRMENIACVLAFNDMIHGGINIDAVFINPITHEAALYGNWHLMKPYIRGISVDLQDIRTMAQKLLGEEYGDAPQPLIRFIEGQPADSAYADFAKWDKVIENELGGRHFTKFKL